MVQWSSIEFSTLKHNLLQMWLPVVGVNTVGCVLSKNIAKFSRDHSSTGSFLRFLWFANEWKIEECLKNFNMEGNIESCFDTKPPFQLGETILTGSFSEGLFLFLKESPDMDFMCVVKNITFTQEDQEHGSLSFSEDTPFVNAFVTNKEAQSLWSDFCDDADTHAEKYRLSSDKLKRRLEDNYGKTYAGLFSDKEQLEEVAEGAAVTISKANSTSFIFDVLEHFAKVFKLKKMDTNNNRIKENVRRLVVSILQVLLKTSSCSDIVLSIYCEGWPVCAREWITRKRVWPDLNSIENIVQAGYHIVPKSSPDGDFRLSFSRAETMLMQTLLPLQHKVMRAFKAVIKYHQDSWGPNLQEILSSYHLKTVAFWHFEKTSQESWNEETLVHHLITLLEELAEAFKIQYLPMYFMPKVNLLEDTGDPDVSLHVVEKIFGLSKNYNAMSDAVKNSLIFKKNFSF